MIYEILINEKRPADQVINRHQVKRDSMLNQMYLNFSTYCAKFLKLNKKLYAIR